jgi:hypothetical protein
MTWIFVFSGVAFLYGVYRFKKACDNAPDPTKDEIIKIISEFLDGGGGPYDWDHFVSIPRKDPEIEKIRYECAQIEFDYPRRSKNMWCNEEGIARLRDILEELKSEGIN